MEKILAIATGLALATNTLGMELAHSDMPLSVTEPSTVVRMANVHVAERVPAPASRMDELAGAAVVGAYLLYRARRARIV